MIAALYVARDSPVHRAAPGLKLLALPVFASAQFASDDLRLQALGLALVLGLAALARLPGRVVLAQLRPLWLVFVLLFATAAWFSGIEVGLLTVLRLSALVLAASLVTLTTRSADMIEALETLFARLAWTGLDPTRISLAISLVLRFLPVMAAVFADIGEAQAARGRGANPFALAVPLVVRTLKMADEIAEAIDARS